MLRISCTLITVATFMTAVSGNAQETVIEAEPTPWYENNDQVAYQDNTGPLASTSSDNTADIVNEADAGTSGALKGEITLKLRDGDIAEVYANGNLVEKFIKGAGTVGDITAQSISAVEFTPAGRPVLHCPAQSTAGWFGPCKLDESQS